MLSYESESSDLSCAGSSLIPGMVSFGEDLPDRRFILDRAKSIRPAQLLHAFEPVLEVDETHGVQQIEPEKFFERIRAPSLGAQQNWLVFAGLEVLVHLARDAAANAHVSHRSRLERLRSRAIQSRYIAILRVREAAETPAMIEDYVLRAMHDWLELICSDRPEDTYFRQSAGVDRDEALRSALFEPRSARLHGHLRDPYGLREAPPRDHSDRSSESLRARARASSVDFRQTVSWLVESWYLPRFDLEGALGLMVSTLLSPLSLSQFLLRDRGFGLRWLTALSLAIAASQVLGWMGPRGWTNTAIAAGLGTACLLGVSAVVLSLRTGIPFVYLTLPRLAAGIAAGGLVAIAMPDQLLDVLFEPDPERLYSGFFPLLAVAGIVVTWVYLYAELLRRLGHHTRGGQTRTVRRSLMVVSIAFAQATVMATVVCLLLATPVYGVCGDISSAVCAGLPSIEIFERRLVLVPPVLFYVSCIALIGGVVTQMFWEETPTTGPP